MTGIIGMEDFGKKPRNPHRASNVNDKDERQHRFTPRKLIQALHDEFHFTIDACGHPLSPASQIIGRGYTLVKKCGQLTYGNVYLRPAEGMVGESIFLQPDFSRLGEAALNAFRWMRFGASAVVLLCPWNRQEQPFWQRNIECRRDGRDDPGCSWHLTTRALAPRIRYGNPQDPEGKKAGSPNFGSGLVIWRRT